MRVVVFDGFVLFVCLSLSFSTLFAVWVAFSSLVLLLEWFSSLFPRLERLGELIGSPAEPRRSSFLSSGALFSLSFAPLGVEARPGNPYFQESAVLPR